MSRIKVGINCEDMKPHYWGNYLKSEGFINAAHKLGSQFLGVEYSYFNPKEQYDVVINWEPFEKERFGKYLTIVWVGDTHRIGLKLLVGDKFDILFRRHMTFFHDQDVMPIGKPVYIMPQCVDPVVFDRFNNEPDYAIAWVGLPRPYTWQKQVFEELEKNFKMLTIYDRIPYQEYVKQLNRGKLILNMPIENEINKRFTESMAIGISLMPWGPDYSLLAIPDYHYLQIEPLVDEQGKLDVENFQLSINKIWYYFSKPKELETIRKRGRELILNQFTFEHQVKRVNKVITDYFRRFNLYKKKENDGTRKVISKWQN